MKIPSIKKMMFASPKPQIDARERKIINTPWRVAESPILLNDPKVHPDDEGKSKREIEDDLNAWRAKKDANNSHFIDDRRSYDLDERYEEKIHICHLCKEEWTDSDVGGSFQPGWYQEKAVISELDKQLINHRVIEKLQSHPICHDCRIKNEEEKCKEFRFRTDSEIILKSKHFMSEETKAQAKIQSMCRKIYTTPKQPSFRTQILIEKAIGVQAARDHAEQSIMEESI